MHKKLLLTIAILLCFAVSVVAADQKFTLVIDAGHGGHDAGAIGAISKEKNINLSVALAFGQYVEQNCPDVKVIYTRRTDVFIPLKERASIANRNNADLFISVHTNALPGGKIARGFETYTLGMHRAKDNLDVAMRENGVISMEQGYKQTYQGFDPRSSESYIMFEFIQDKNMQKSVDLARYIQNSVCTHVSVPNKGVHQAGFLVLRETSMPSCLIELGFITTPDEESALNTSSYVDSLAKQIYNGFKQYKEQYYTGLTVPYRATKKAKVEMPKLVPSSYQENNSNDAPKTIRKVVKPAPVVSEKQNAVQPSEAPIFKVQILTSSRELRKGDAHFKGETDINSFKEDNLIKYTVGSSSNYNEIYKLRKSLLEKFPNAFIIAMKGGDKVDVNAAIKEFLKNKKK
jgi:N-acetylmuramoyl-L-alanine amidase